MPLYDYECAECGNVDYDIFASMDEKIGVCSECGADSFRIIASPNLVIRDYPFASLVRKDQLDFEVNDQETVMERMRKQREEKQS